MNYTEIIEALREFTSHQQIDLISAATAAQPISKYPPIHKYVLDLKNIVKPETAAEDLFTALSKDVLGVQPTRQVSSGEGWVDFMLPEKKGSPLPLELKPLFQRDGPDSLWRSDANPKHHTVQVKKYLREHEYLILTDLRTVWLFSARDFSFEDKHFAELPFADFLARCRETASILDTIRRIEDTVEKPELEQQFFEDLKIWFHEFDKVKWSPPEKAAESIILLINKLIFARTIEDYGLVQYRFLQNEYARFTELWEPKGAHRVIPKFLAFFEEFFDEYYDTEIFSERIWDRLEKSEDNLRRFSEKLNFVLGVSTWDKVFARGIVHYNYRRIDEDIFGKSYEMFLAANRKDEGIYYTPAGITGPMADSMVDSLTSKIVDDICAAVSSQKCDFAQAESLMAQLAEIRVADTACGSGGFLIKVLRAFWRQYQRIDNASAWVQKMFKSGNGELSFAELPPNVESALGFRRRQNFDNRRVLIAQILLRHIFGVDKDPGAIEVAKTNIWKEAVKLSPADYNYRLLKTDIVKILPNLELNFHSADSLVDVELSKQAAWLAEYHQSEIRKLSELRARYTANPMDHAPLDEALVLREKVRAHFIEHFQPENLPCTPGAFTLHFWPCWFKPDGTPIQNPGFDGIIGNPPWETFKPIRKEFAASIYRDKPQFSKMGMDGPQFEKWFDQELKTKSEFSERWHEHEAYYERHKEFFGRTYVRQGTGDWNLFKLFIERDLSLVCRGGQFSLLVPSGFQTDEGCADLRRWFLSEHRLEELTSFENRGYSEVVNGEEKPKQIFPDVDNRFKFGYFKVTKGVLTGKDHEFKARFYLHDPKDFSCNPIRYAAKMIHLFSPHNESFMEFRSEIDYQLATKIRSNHQLLGDFGYVFRRELHMTGDSQFFQSLRGETLKKNQLRLFEGKMIHQFDSNFIPAINAVDESEIHEELLRKEIFRLAQFVRDEKLEKIDGKELPDSREDLYVALRKLFKKEKFKLQYEYDRLAYREVARSTDERTIIAAIIPKGTVMVHTLMYLAPFNYEIGDKRQIRQIEIPKQDIHLLLGLANSLTLNFYIRSKVSAHVSAFQFLELPAPKANALQKQKIGDLVNELLKKPRSINERAELEVIIARDLYGLSRSDWTHLTDSFTFGSGATKEELDEIIRLSRLLWSK